MASDAAAGDGFGSAAAGLGDYTASGAPHNGNGVVYVYNRDHGGKGAWGELTTLEVPANQSPGGSDKFGSALAFGEDEETGTQYLAVGAEAHGGCGAVFIFYLLLGTWTYLQKLAPINILTLGALFGCSLSMFGTMLAVGAKNQGGVGAVFIFTLAVTLFTLFQTVTAIGGVAGDLFGFAVALYGVRLLVGAPGRMVSTEEDDYAGAGVAYLFTAVVVGALFSLGHLTFFSGHPGINHAMGSSLAAGKDSIAIGIPGFANVLIWALVGGAWIHRAALFGAAGSCFGTAVRMNYFGDVAVGAPKAKGKNNIIAGAIYIFLLNAITLTYASSGDRILPSTNPDPGMLFGATLVLLGLLLFGFAPNYNAGQGAFFLILLAATALTYSTWILLFFAKSLVENVALAHLYGIFGDFDGDGIPNFLEYLMNMLPTVFDVDPLRAIISAAGLFTLLLPVSLITLNALFVIQYSFNMATWFALGLGLLAGLLSTRIRYPGITTNLLLLTMSVALATLINPRFFLRYYGEVR